MGIQAGKLSILQLKALLDPHKRHLREWNSYQIQDQEAFDKLYEAKKEAEENEAPQVRVNYGVDWNENFFKVMMTDIMLEELEKIEDHIDFRSTLKLQKLNKRRQRPILKKLKRIPLHQVLEKLSVYVTGKKDKESMSKSEVMFETKCDGVKDEDDGYCSEQTADLTSDDSDLEERT